jgi:hypothetical protein
MVIRKIILYEHAYIPFLLSLSHRAPFSLSKCILERSLIFGCVSGSATGSSAVTWDLDTEVEVRGSTPTWHAGEALKRTCKQMPQRTKTCVGAFLVTKHYNEPLGGTWHLGFGSAR